MFRGLLGGWDGQDKPKRPPNREIVYEVLAMGEEGCWVIDQVFDEEETALARADEMLGEKSVRQVQVVRERSSKRGPRLTAVVYERSQTGRPGKPPVTLAAPAAGEAWCATLPDLFADDSRRMIGRLLRNFLDRHQATPIELLCDYRLYRKLDAEGSLASAAIQRMATLQAERRGLDVGGRTRELEKLVAEAVKLARAHGAERRRPRLRAEDGAHGGLPALRQAARRFASDPFKQLYAVQAAVAEALRQIPNVTGKLERVLELLPETPAGAELADLALVDGLLADCLGCAQTTQDLLGRQPDLGAALTHLARLVTCRSDGPPPDAPAFFSTVETLIGTHGLPASRAVLLDRLLRELGGDRPLSREDATVQRKLLKAIAALLMTPDGTLLGGGAAADAFGRRARNLGLRNGFVDLAFRSEAPLERLQQVLEADEKFRAEDAKLCLATYAVELSENVSGASAACLALAQGFAASRLPEGTRRKVVERLNAAADASAPGAAE